MSRTITLRLTDELAAWLAETSRRIHDLDPVVGVDHAGSEGDRREMAFTRSSQA